MVPPRAREQRASGASRGGGGSIAPRRATPVLAPPTADLVLIDGDNVRGKTAFAVSAQSLLAQTRTFAATQDAVLYIDHGLAAECLAVEDNLRVVFAGTAQSADDCIVRDVAFLLEENPTLSVSVVTSDSGLIARWLPDSSASPAFAATSSRASKKLS